MHDVHYCDDHGRKRDSCAWKKNEQRVFRGQFAAFLFFGMILFNNRM